MSEMVDRVARALTANEPHRIHGDYHLSDEEYVESWWQKAVPQARAAIAAMREPTGVMVDEGDGAVEMDSSDVNGSWFYRYHDGGAADVWRAMIDAAQHTDSPTTEDKA